MQNRLIKSFFSSGLQAISVQILGTIFFYVISLFLSKEDFGIISWSNATSAFIITILSFGLEQVVVRRIALSKTSDWAAIAYFFHAVTGAVISMIVLLVIKALNPAVASLQMLPWFFLAQSMVYLATPLKQYLNAKEKFTPYGVISFISNAGRIAVALAYISGNRFTLQTTIYILVGSALFELLSLILFSWLKTDLVLKFRWSAYKKLILEAQAVYMATLFDSSLSVMDRILLGIVSTNVITADYNFAYKAYEVSKLPILIVGPIILPKLARLFFHNNDKLAAQKKRQVSKFFAIEIFFAVLMVLLLNIVWTPWVGAITHGKYGPSNSFVFLILSLCIPIQFAINLLWTLTFSGKHYKSITVVTVITAVLNIILNLVFIPHYGGNGAAIAFILSVTVQLIAYNYVVNKNIMTFSLLPLLSFPLMGAAAYMASIYITDIVLLRIGIALSIYLAAAIGSKQVGRPHIDILKQYLRR